MKKLLFVLVFCLTGTAFAIDYGVGDTFMVEGITTVPRSAKDNLSQKIPSLPEQTPASQEKNIIVVWDPGTEKQIMLKHVPGDLLQHSKSTIAAPSQLK